MGADYRLLYPSTGFDIIEDMKALFSFLADPKFSQDHLPSGISLDANRIALVGASGGAYPAMAAGIHAHPKPKALLLLFGMGGDMLGDGWVKPKDGFVGRRRKQFGSILREFKFRMSDACLGEWHAGNLPDSNTGRGLGHHVYTSRDHAIACWGLSRKGGPWSLYIISTMAKQHQSYCSHSPHDSNCLQQGRCRWD